MKNGDLPYSYISVYHRVADLLNKDRDFPGQFHSYVSLPEGKNLTKPPSNGINPPQNPMKSP